VFRARRARLAQRLALIIKGPGGTRHEKVSATLRLKAKGIYRITMVKHAPRGCVDTSKARILSGAFSPSG
jgi:hypothetical protein